MDKKEMMMSEITKKLLSVASICKGGPSDLADNHDYYLYGFPKNKKRFFFDTSGWAYSWDRV